MSVAQVYQTPLLTEYTPSAPKAPPRTNPLYGWLVDIQERIGDAVAAFGSAANAWRESRTADDKHDRCLELSRQCNARREYAMADYWAEQAQHWDALEDRKVTRVWFLFGQTAQAERENLNAIAVLLTPSRQRAGKGRVTR